MQCPKCRGAMRTYDRSGVHIEQCDSCRGIFLDYGELEHLNQLEGFSQPAAPPPAYGQPAWGHRGHGHHKRGGFGRMLFSS
ncbi:MAG: zf-TFIIB domain-containing protein [Micromonosporaceae bacterium]